MVYNEILYELLEEVLGEPKKVYESKGQVSYNCPICDEDKNKGNLEINICHHVRYRKRLYIKVVQVNKSKSFLQN